MRKEGSTLVKQTNPNENIEATPKSVWPLGGAYHLGDTYAHKEQWWTKCGSIVGRILATMVGFLENREKKIYVDSIIYQEKKKCYV